MVTVKISLLPTYTMYPGLHIPPSSHINRFLRVSLSHPTTSLRLTSATPSQGCRSWYSREFGTLRPVAAKQRRGGHETRFRVGTMIVGFVRTTFCTESRMSTMMARVVSLRTSTSSRCKGNSRSVSLWSHRRCLSTTTKHHHRQPLVMPTSTDTEELFRCMNSRQGSLIVHEDPSKLLKYNQDWTKIYLGQSSVIVRPKTTLEVSNILKYCHHRNIGVVPQGGNTGLVGGSVSKESNEIILSLEGLSTIYGLDLPTGILRAQSGCILEDLHTYAAGYDYLVPLDLGSKGTCQIGGNLSTNAGGSYYYRYGSLHATTVGLEVVLPDGTILNLGYDPSHLKDNTGYHLKHLFIGAEGTLGIITGVALLCPRRPSYRGATLLACHSYEQVYETLALAKSQLGEILAAFEFMDKAVLTIVTDRMKTTSPLDGTLPFSTIPNYAILVETHGSSEEHDQIKLQQFVETAFEQGLVRDGTIAQNLRQVQDFWKIRESCNPSVASRGYVYKYDVSLPIQQFEHFIQDIQTQLEEEDAISTNWGHVIDGNLHLNVIIPGQKERDDNLYYKLEDIVIRGVMNIGGSISAEHGLGQYKNIHLAKIKDVATLKMMQQVKNLFDPHGIMNPGKVLPP